MSALLTPEPATAEIAAELTRLSAAYAPTPLFDLRRLAACLGVAQVLVKDEGKRRLGSFKSLGGTYAGLRALARAASMDIAALLASQPPGQPTLICASDGNHGLAVAAAGRFAGAATRVYLHAAVPEARVRRIEAEGAEIVRVEGTYDNAIDAAARAAVAGAGVLVADTTDDPDDPVVRDVMAGYGVIAAEIRAQVEAAAYARPTHLFVQAGVGGFAAALADGLADWLEPPSVIVVVEPETAPAVARALAAGCPVRLEGALETAAEMLSCGEASAPALTVLRRHDVRTMTVSEYMLATAPVLLHAYGGPRTTPSGAAGLAGLVEACASTAGPCEDARVLIVATEADVEHAP